MAQPAAAQRADRISTGVGSSSGQPGVGLGGSPVSGTQLAMLGVVLALVLVLNDRSPDFVRYTLWLTLAYLLLTNAQHLAPIADRLVGTLNTAARG